MAAAAVLSGLQVYNGLQNADMIRANAKLTAQIAEINAKAREADAFNATADGETDVARYAAVVDGIGAEQQANYAAADVDITFGSAKDFQEESKLNGFLNTLDIREQAHAKALGYQREARSIRLQGAMGQLTSEASAIATRNAGFLNAGATLATGYTREKPKRTT